LGSLTLLLDLNPEDHLWARWHMHWERFCTYQEKGKLPYKTISVEYELEYGTDILEMHIDAIKRVKGWLS